jgi:hypothetical protein
VRDVARAEEPDEEQELDVELVLVQVLELLDELLLQYQL